MDIDASQYLNEADVWAQSVRESLSKLVAEGKDDTPEYASLAASLASFLCLRGIASLLRENRSLLDESVSLAREGNAIAETSLSVVEHLESMMEGEQGTEVCSRD